MLSQPTSKRFLEAIQHTLRADVAPAVSSKDAKVMLQAIDAILAGLIRRVGIELAWMQKEIADIEQAAEAVITAGADTGGAVARALDEVRANRSTSGRPEDVEADYARASALLSQCLEQALIIGGAVRAQVEVVLEARLETEGLVLGAFKVVGKD